MGDRIRKLISSNFMGMVRSVSVLFETGATYSCYSNKGDFVKLEEKKFPRRIKGIVKVQFMDLGFLYILSEMKVDV